MPQQVPNDFSTLSREFGPTNPTLLGQVRGSLPRADGPQSDAIDIFLAFLQEYFATSSNIREDWKFVRDANGAMDIENTKIVITDDSSQHRELTVGRPIIETVLGPYGYLNLGINQFAYTNMMDPEQKTQYLDMMAGQIVVNVYSSSKLEAMALARIVQFAIVAHRGTIEKMGFNRIDPRVQVGAAIPGGMLPNVNSDLIPVPVTVTWYKSDAWTRHYTKPTPTVKAIEVVPTVTDTTPETKGSASLDVVVEGNEEP